ncbi:hypothetical protein B0I35DRAFT_417284 [Stachybotrys elegans]|uniref:Atos-like conserved domain-containing protein n=1 Tax=Stachybotrys elegans TaxID=80388 RepID=A0A8K0T1G2_9HYPO|nr:hypothetical protein B0I35DRAFT_417284 [Stachybotrys elegans]
MPIFQSDIEPARPPGHDEEYPLEAESVTDHDGSAEPPRPSRLRRLSEESLATELCEGPIPDSPPALPASRIDKHDSPTPDRAELIQKLKRAQSPTWLPGRHFESILHHGSPAEPSTPRRPSSQSSSLLPPAQITPEKPDQKTTFEERLRDGLSIERPRSALHSGDFTHDTVGDEARDQHLSDKLIDDRGSLEDQWAATSPPRHFIPYHFERQPPRIDTNVFHKSSASPLSSSLSSFVYQPPTSPLVQSESNEEQDLSASRVPIDFPTSRPNSMSYVMNSAVSSPFASPSPRILGRSSSHRPQKIFDRDAQPPAVGYIPQAPAFLRSRRQSISSDCSPIQHASMVGSYEESILRGRMSTTPSKPLDFVAQIGVLGIGKCKASLRCPPHVTLPFPAVYYSYSSTAHGRSRSEDGPSPYVGQIDLENGLPNSDEDLRTKRKAQSRYSDHKSTAGDADVDMESAQRANPRSKRRPGSPRAPPGGSYRIPEKGQMQIIIKNPNKTAVKLFLIPYDLAGMEPGTKTFIRQRSYSAGPIVDAAPGHLAESSAFGRPILRYLAHLHICCPSKGRFYLYKSIRIVFANRVPDDKEKLRIETTWPEPRFSPYKPVRVMHPPVSGSTGPGATLAAEKAFRRRSLGFTAGASSRAFDMLDGVGSPCHAPPIPVDPIPFCLPPRERFDSNASEMTETSKGILSPELGAQSPVSESVPSSSFYEKLNRGDAGYGGNAFGPSSGSGSPGGAEGLLSQRLRSLGVKGAPPDTQED